MKSKLLTRLIAASSFFLFQVQITPFVTSETPKIYKETTKEIVDALMESLEHKPYVKGIDNNMEVFPFIYECVSNAMWRVAKEKCEAGKKNAIEKSIGALLEESCTDPRLLENVRKNFKAHFDNNVIAENNELETLVLKLAEIYCKKLGITKTESPKT